MKFIKGLLSVIGFIVVIGFVVGKMNTPTVTVKNALPANNSPLVEVTEVKTTPAKEVKTTQPEEIIEGSAQDLIAIYETNKLKADQLYKGKVLKITGEVKSIDTFLNDIIVTLNDESNMFLGVRCYMDSSQTDKVADLVPGQEVIIAGRGDGETLGSPTMRKCIIIE